MAGVRPWVAWYPSDILNDPKYICLDRSAKLTYRELLDRLWISGCALPNDEKKLSALAGIPLVKFKKDWKKIQDPHDPCFVLHPNKEGYLTNHRMLQEWERASNAMRYGASQRDHIQNWHKTRMVVFEIDDFTCQYCGQKGGDLECDHIIPLSRGGTSDPDNLITSCRCCNRSKGGLLLDEWLQ
jgi:hypothetical protein